MDTPDRPSGLFTRRDFGRVALAAAPGALLLANAPAWAAEIKSKLRNVQIGAITYSFNQLAANPDDIVKAYITIGLGEMELMSNHAEALAGAPSGRAGGAGALGGGRGGGRGAVPAGSGAPAEAAPPAGTTPAAAAPGATAGAAPAGGGGQGRGGRGPLTPEQQAAQDAARQALQSWRMSATAATFRPVRKKIEDAGIDLHLLCFNLQDSMTDEMIDYAFMMAKALDVKTITTSTTLTMARRVVPFAAKHKINVAFHGHDNLQDPNQFAKPESFLTAMGMSKYYMVNLDIGHFTSAGYDPIPFIKEHHRRVSNLHLKDKHNPANGRRNVPWGQGDTPIKDVLLLMSKEKYDFPGNIEFEYGGDPLVEVPKCFEYIKSVLA